MILNDHLLQCEDCKHMFERIQQLSDHLTQLPKVNPPYSIVDQIMPQLEALRADNRSGSSGEGERTSQVKTRRFNRMARVISGVAAAALIVVLSWSQFPFTPTSVNDMAMDMAESAGFVTMSDQTGQSDAPGAASKGLVVEDQMGLRLTPEATENADDMANRQSQSVEDGGGHDGDFEVSMTANRSVDEFVSTESPLHFSSQYEVNGVSVDADRLSTGHQYPSPDEGYVAIVISEEQIHQIVIVNQHGEEVYVSRQFAADEVTKVEWTEDGKNVRYETVRGEHVTLSNISVE